MPHLLDLPFTELQAYSYAVEDWITAVLPPVIPVFTDRFVITYATAQREFIVCHPPNSQLLGLDSLSIPRASITPLDLEIDIDRINTGILRKVCYATEEKKVALNARFPVPVNVPYQIDIWTKYTHDMLRYVQAMIFQFTGTIKYLKVNVDKQQDISTTLYGNKWFPIKLDSISNTSDLEPGETEVLNRHTFNVTGQGYIFDRNFEEVRTVLSASVDWYDGDTDELLETQIIPTPPPSL